jgi:osmoprotectant transport system permease protein
MSLDYLFENSQEVWDLSIEHLQLVLVALFIALLVAMPVGIFVARFQKSEVPILGALGATYAVPSLALLALLIPWTGIGNTTAIITLAVYSQVFLVRNIVAGLRGVDDSVLEVARGVGMTRWQVFAKVQMPLAFPVILAGIRIALVTTISLATIAAWINAGGLGSLLFNGIARNNTSMILAGTIAVTALAILVDQMMRFLARFTAVGRARRASNS